MTWPATALHDKSADEATVNGVTSDDRRKKRGAQRQNAAPRTDGPTRTRAQHANHSPRYDHSRDTRSERCRSCERTHRDACCIHENRTSSDPHSFASLLAATLAR